MEQRFPRKMDKFPKPTRDCQLTVMFLFSLAYSSARSIVANMCVHERHIHLTPPPFFFCAFIRLASIVLVGRCLHQ